MKIGKERRNFHIYFMFSYMSSSQILGGIDGGDLKKISDWQKQIVLESKPPLLGSGDGARGAGSLGTL